MFISSGQQIMFCFFNLQEFSDFHASNDVAVTSRKVE